MKAKISNWNNYPSVEAEINTFVFIDHLRDYMLRVNECISRGNGRCYGDASLASNIISTMEFDKIISFDAERGVFECQSGVTLEKILEVVIPKGWFLPVTPGTKFITIGGAVASDVHGKNHHVEGSFCRYVTEMEIMLPDGEVVSCSRDRYGDLFEASCGGMGLTGIILSIKFILKRIETSYIIRRQIRTLNLDDTIRHFDLHKASTYSVAWIDCLKRGKHFGRGVFILGEHASAKELDKVYANRPLSVTKSRYISFPGNCPSWILNKYSVKLFNQLFYYSHLNNRKTVSYNTFFYPLDSILHWNRGYGSKGFLQYQFVLPFDRYEGLVEILELICKAGAGSFLTVLKIFGHQDGLLSFPMKGYTLALDFPIRKGVFEFLNCIDRLVLKHSGRLYLSKDARMKSEIFKEGYPQYKKFVGIIKKYNPQRKMWSMLADRLLIGE